jgi:eukaryotic-like serine/threonine-protein kinase
VAAATLAVVSGDMAEAPQKKRPDQRIGSFVVLDELKGAGGLARAFRARYRPQAGDPPLALDAEDVVLVRVLRDQAVRDPSLVNAFTREAELLALIDHPCMVRGITRGVTSGRIWMATEYVEGEDLTTVLKVATQEGLRLKPEIALVTTLDLLAGLAAAQGLADARGRPMGLVHRGVAPGHVLVDLRGQSHLTDLGAALLSLKEEPGDELVGQPGYLSPEQARREPLTQGSDVYAVGLILFELLSGVRAFDGPTDDVVAAHAENRRAPWPDDVDLPFDLKALVDQATADTPEERPADAAAMYALVEGLLDDPDDARARLALVVRDLVRTNPDRAPPLFVTV